MKLTILLLFLPFLSYSQYIPVEIEVFRHMARTIDSCNTIQSAAEKDSVIHAQNFELKRQKIKIQNQDTTISYVVNEREECEFNKHNLTKDYMKLSKKKKSEKWYYIGGGVVAAILTGVFKHNYDLQKNR